MQSRLALKCGMLITVEKWMLPNTSVSNQYVSQSISQQVDFDDCMSKLLFISYQWVQWNDFVTRNEINSFVSHAVDILAYVLRVV